MRRLLTCLILLVLTINVFGQDRELIKKTLDLVKETYVIYEANPTYISESDSIVKFLHYSIERHLSEEVGKYDEEMIFKGFKNLNKNSSSWYEDSSELRRMQLRRAACFASIALLSDLKNGLTYLKYAKYALVEGTKKSDYELLEEQYLSLLFLELLFEYEDKQSIKVNLSELIIYLRENKENLSKEVVRKATSLIDIYQGKTDISLHIQDQCIDRMIVLENKSGTSIKNVYADTLIKLSDDRTLFSIDRRKSDIGTGLLFLSKTYQIIEYEVDDWSFTLDIYKVDIDGDGVEEVLTIWSDESVFYIIVYSQVGGIKKCYKSDDIGNPDLWNGKKVSINNGKVTISYQKEDSTHVKARLLYNKQLKKFELKEIERVNL